MAIENVGLERLPNIYFRKIKLMDHDTKSFKVAMNLLVVDELVDNNFIWSEDPLLRDFMKFAIIETENLELIDELTNGDLSPHPSSVVKSPNFDDYSKVHIFGYGDLKKAEDIDDKHFTLMTDITKRNETQNLTLFAVAYLDHKEMSNFLHINLTGPLASYMGPLTSERVMTLGETQKASTGFKRPNGELWSGPVHVVDGEWYSGSQINDDSIKLEKITTKNQKLIDIRSKLMKDRSKTWNLQSTIFSDLHHSFGKNSDLFALFSIDLRQFVLSKTTFGRKIYGLSDTLFDAAVNNIQINSLEIRRRQVNLRRQANILGTGMYVPEDILPYRVVATLRDLKEMDLVDDPNIKTFTFSDLEMTSRSRGEFVYEAHATFIDNTQVFIENIVRQMKTDLNDLKDQVRRLNLSANFDYNKGELRQTYTIPESLSNRIDNYYEYLSIMKDVQQEDLNQMISDKKSLFKTSTYSPNVGLGMVSEYEKLYSSFTRRFGIEPKELRQSRNNPRSSYPPNLISLKKTFGDVIQFSNALGSYDLLGVDGNRELLEITKEDFINRADSEIDRFFDRSKSVSSEDTFSVDDEVSSALRDLKTPSYSFMAPLKFDMDGKVSDLTSLQSADTDGLSMQFITLKEEVEEKKHTSKRRAKLKGAPKRAKKSSIKKPFRKRIGRRKFKFNFRPPALKINRISEKREDYRESTEYLGGNSEFVNIDNNLDTKVEAKDTSQIINKVKIANEVSVSRTKKRFDLTEKNNLVEKFKSSKNYSQARLRKMPLALKSLFNSRSSAARNNVLEAESDILKDTETKVATEMIFHTNQKIQALIGYDRAPDGSIILSKPMWGDITDELLETKSRLLCRAIYQEQEDLGLSTAPEFKLPVENSTFIIIGDGVGDLEPVIPDIISELPEVEMIAYTTSNVVRQREA
jgi:hypothetical protein